MSDNNRLELDIIANDDTGPATAKARANFSSIEQQAAKTAANMSKGFDAQAVSMGQSIDRASASAIRSLDALERRAALAGKSAVEKLVLQRNQMISSLGSDEAAIQRTMAAYDKLISARQKYEERMAKMDSGHGGHGVGSMVARRGFLALKDAGEGRTSGVFAEVADIMFGQGGTGGVIQKVLPEISALTGLSNTAVVAVGALAGAFAGLGIAGVESMKHLAEVGEDIQNFSLRTGIAPTRVQAFQFAATATGQDPAIFEKMTRGLAQASEDDSPSGAKARKELDQLGVSLYDRFGDLKPTEQIITDLADGLNKLPPGLERSASSMEIFKRIGVEAIPVLEGLRKNLATSDEIGNTFSERDLAMMERWNESLKRMGEEWKRFKLSVEVPLGVVGEVTLKGIHILGMSGFGAPGTDYGKQLGEYVNNHLFQQGEITPPMADPDALRKIAEKDLADQERAKFLAMQQQDPAFRLSEARKKLTEYQALAQHGSLDDVQRAEEQFRLVKSLEQKSGTNAALEGVVAARKERLQLEAQYAEIQQSSQQKLLSAGLDSRHELSTPEDISAQLQLAKQRVDAEQQKALNDRRYKVDDKTGTIRDLSGTADYQRFQGEETANLPLRLRNEYAKVLGELEAQDARYFKARNDADGKAWEEAWQRRKKGELDLQQEEISTRQQIQSRQFDIDAQSIDRQKEMALQGLDSVDAQTLQEKIALEDRKLAIEQAYAERSLANQIAKLQNEEVIAVGAIRKKAAEDGNTGTPAEAADIAAKQGEYQQQIDAARAATGDREKLDSLKAINDKEKLQIESNKRVYDSLKHDAEGLFDQMVYHTKSWGDFAKDMGKAVFLTPLKEIFSSQTSAVLTQLFTGQKVTFGEVGNGQGTFGKLGSIFGRAGLGQPKFGDTNHALAKLNAPNHLGDVSLVSGAVPVVITNAAQMAQAHVQVQAQSARSLNIGSVLGMGGLLAAAAGASPAGSSVTSTISYATGGSDSFSSLTAGGIGASGSGPSWADVMFPNPTPPPYTEASGASGGSGGGMLGSLKGMLSSGGGNLKSFFGQDSLGTDLGNGMAIANTGMMGHLAAFGKSNAAAMIGAGLVMDGLSRKPGKASAVETPLGAGMIGFKLGGTGGALIGAGIGLGADGLRRGGYKGMMEDAAGGALIGFQVGGPAGAAVGAVIGGAVGFARMFMKGDRGHAKDLVKQVYGMDINNATADQIVQIAKQSYGGQIDVAVRSQQVRDLLKLYAQATGQKGAEDKFVQDSVHSASFVESGGKLFQNAVYDNGNAYSYQSPLSTYGGVTTAPLSTYAPNNGVFSGNLQILLNGDSANSALAGQVTRVVTPGFVQNQSLAASNGSVGRTAQQNMVLSPSALKS